MARNETIAARGEPVEHYYLVIAGCVRTVRQMTDGRRQIGEFLLPGELFGWEEDGAYSFSAEAVTPAMLHGYKRTEIDAFLDQDRDFARNLRRMMAKRLRGGREHIVLLGCGSSSERIASFVLYMADRMNPGGRDRIELAMGRDDIADYLGLTIETVSRHLSRLRRQGAISVDRASIVIYDRVMLELASTEPATL